MERNLFTQIKQILYRIVVWSVVVVLAACTPVAPVSTPEQTVRPQVTSTRRTPASSPQPAVSPTHTKQPQKVITVKQEELRGLVIRFWHNWSGASGEAITAAVDEFNLTNPYGVLAVASYQGTLDEIDQKLDLFSDHADRPDIVVGYLHQALAWDDQFGLADLDDYLMDPTWGYTVDEQADFWPVFVDQNIVQGKRLGIPAQRAGQVLFYNQSWAAELGFSALPQSSEAFSQQACAAARANGAGQAPAIAGAGGWVISTDYPVMLSWMVAFGAKIYQEKISGSSQVSYLLDHREVLQTYEFLRGLYDNGCAWLPENTYPATYFAERKALFASGSVTDIPYFMEAMRKAGNQDRWTVLAYPGPDDSHGMVVYGTDYQILQSSEKQELAAWLLLKWLLLPENQSRLVQTTYSFPLRISEGKALAQSGEQTAAWTAALDLLQFAQAEPPLRSWSLVRWAISDSATQLFRSYTSMEQVPALVRYLDNTAGELHLMVNKDK